VGSGTCLEIEKQNKSIVATIVFCHINRKLAVRSQVHTIRIAKGERVGKQWWVGMELLTNEWGD